MENLGFFLEKIFRVVLEYIYFVIFWIVLIIYKYLLHSESVKYNY